MAGRKILLLLNHSVCLSLPITDISFSTIKNYIRASNNLRQKMNVPKILLSFLLSVQELSCVRCGTAQPLPAPLCWVPLWVQLHCRFPPRSSAGALKHGVLLVRAVLQGEESRRGEGRWHCAPRTRRECFGLPIGAILLLLFSHPAVWGWGM